MEKQKGKRYPKEIRDKAVRMVAETKVSTPLSRLASSRLQIKLGMTPETLRKWVRTAKDTGQPLANGLATAEQMKSMEREVKELRRSNEILKGAAAFFVAELDRQQK